MTVKDYLKQSQIINMSALAKEMYPNNKDAASYLVRKLNNSGRPFTEKDAIKALEVLKKLSINISELTV